MKSNLNIFFLTVLFISCKNISTIEGSYYLKNNRLVGNRMELNENNTFFQHIKTDLCNEKIFFGTYTISHRKIILTPFNHTPVRSMNEDKLFYRNDFDTTNLIKMIFYKNESDFLEDIEIYSDSVLLGKTDRNGVIFLQRQSIQSNRITVERFAYKTKHISLDSLNQYTQVYFILYYTDFLPCIEYYFENNLIISKRGLELDRVIAKKERKKYAYFKKIKED